MKTERALSRVTAVQARAEAEGASTRAGVIVVQACGHDDLKGISLLSKSIWGETKAIPVDILQAVAFAGGTLLSAIPHGARGPVGFAFGFMGWDPVPHLHSHMAAVLPEWRSNGVGLALKATQRAECLNRGVTEIRWTFDPLVRVNACFNLLRLGVTAPQFLPNFYGRMGDDVNGSDVSDRFEAVWDLERRLPATAPRVVGRAPLVTVDSAGHPQRSTVPIEIGAILPVPHHFVSLRANGDVRASEWRWLTGALLAEIYRRGLAVVTLNEQGYLLGAGAHE